MGFRKVRLFEITTEVGSDGYPVYSTTPIRLQGTGTEEDFNSVSIKLSSVKKTKILVADDLEKVNEIEVGYDIELEVLNVEAAASEDAFGFVKDTNGNIKEVVNGTKKKFGLFFEGKTANGIVFQKYLYKLKFGTPDLVYEAYVKIVDSDKIENIKKTFEAMRYVSIGGNKSIGYNLFDCIDFKSVNDIPENQGPKLLLSKAIGDDSVNLKESNYQLKVLHNKLNNIKPTKHRQTVLAFVEGSMIHTNKEYIGKLISDSINQKLIYQNMLGLLI
jgi:CRISPR/Cas system CSM-associated protein Csm4 (group 5 of RAMP superfamily)